MAPGRCIPAGPRTPFFAAQPRCLEPTPAGRYYAYWEQRLFSAVCGMVVGSLQALHDRLRACRPHGAGLPHGEDAEVVWSAKLPLFRVRGLHFAALQ